MVQQSNQGGGGGRQINVDTARVARAEVTRMNVAGGSKDTADELLAEIEDSSEGSIKGHLDKIRQAVEDCCSTTDAKAAKEANKSLTKATEELAKTFEESSQEELTKTLDSLDKNIEVLITTMSTGGGGGEGGGGGGAGPDLARVRQTEQEIQVIGDAFLSLKRGATGLERYNRQWVKMNEQRIDEGIGFSKTLIRMGKETIEAQTIGAFNSMIESIQDVVASIADLRAETRKSIAVAKESIEVTRQGMVTAGQFFVDDWNQLWEGAGAILTGDFNKLGDSIKNTLQTLETARTEEGLGIASVLIQQTDSMDELGGYMKDARTAMFDGNNLRRMMKDEEANLALIETLSIQRRAGIMGEMSAADLGRKAEQRSNILATIAANTGMTVEQLMQAGKEESKSFEMLHAMNLINDKQLINLQSLAKTSPELGGLLAKAAEARFNEVTFFRMFPEMKEMIVKGQAQGEFRDFLAAAKTGSAADDVRDAYKDIVGAAKPLTEQMMRQAKELGPDIFAQQQEVFGLAAGLRKLPAEMKESILPDKIASTWNSITSLFDNMFPGGSVGLIRALSANTVAVLLNTGAQMGLGRKLLSWGGKFLGLGKGLIGGVGKIGTMLTGLAAKLAPLLLVVAKLAGAIALAAGIGVGLGLLFNKIWEKISGFFGGAGSLGSDIADMVDEFKYAASGDPDSGAAPQKSMADMTIAEKMSRYGPGVMDFIPGLNMVASARRTARMVGDVRSMSGPSAPPVPGSPPVATPGAEGPGMSGTEGWLSKLYGVFVDNTRHAKDTADELKKKKSGGAPVGGDVSLVATGSPSG